MSSAVRRRTAVRRPWDWAYPVRPLAHREVLHEAPAEVEPRKAPLLFVHGTAHGAWCFEENFLPACAAKGFDAYAVSLRGHGGSAGHRELVRTTTRDYVHDVLQTIAELPAPPVLVGHSMGAIVAQLVADRYPLRGLVLLTPAPMHSAIGGLATLFREKPGVALGVIAGRTLSMAPEMLFAGLPPEQAAAYSARTGRESPLVQYEWLLPRKMGPIRCPVLVVGAGHDRLVRRRDVELTAASFGVQPVWFEQIGHDVMLDSGWPEVLTEILEFADAAPPWGTAARR